MIRRPPRSTLFPTRRSSDLLCHARVAEIEPAAERHLNAAGHVHTDARTPMRDVTHRSEEHTSELQSRLHLVCRLLLEKKKKMSERLHPPHHSTHHHSPDCGS